MQTTKHITPPFSVKTWNWAKFLYWKVKGKNTWQVKAWRFQIQDNGLWFVEPVTELAITHVLKTKNYTSVKIL